MSALIPSTGRPDTLRTCLEGLRATTRGYDVEIVAAVDADEPSRRVASELADVVSYSDEYRGVAGAWNDALALATGDLLVWVGDDTEWSEGWLDAALACEAEHPDWLVGLNDGYTPPDRATHLLMSRRFVVDVLGGVVAWPEYVHSFHDAEIYERAKRADRYVWCGESLVRHVHWLWGSRSQDDTDRRNLGGHPDSQRRFDLRAAAGFPNDYEPVIKE